VSIKKITKPRDGGWHCWFAWHSVETICGHRVWWERVERRWNTEKSFRIIDICDPGDYDGGWDYRIIPIGETP